MIPKLKRALLGFCGVLIAFYGVSVVMLYVNQRDLMYKPPAVNNDASYLSSFEKVEIPTEGAPDLPSFYKKARGDKPTILAFHGNGEDAASSGAYLHFLSDAGYGLLLAEYRGYGGNEGETTKDGIYTDAQAALNWLNTEQDVPDTHIIALGLSLGSAPASYLAGTRDDLLGAVLIVPFSRMDDLAQSYYPLVPYMSLLLKDNYDNTVYLEESDVPKLIIAAGEDEIVPNRFARDLYEKAAMPKAFVYISDAGHLNIIDKGADSDILRFVSGLEMTL